MKKATLLVKIAFLFSTNITFSADTEALKKQCDQSIMLASKQSDHNKERLNQARNIFDRIKTQTPPVTELDYKKCIYYAYDSSPSLTNPPGYETEPTETITIQEPPFKYPYPAFSSPHLHSSWRQEMVKKAAELCSQTIQNISKKEPHLLEPVLTEQEEGNNISIDKAVGEDLIRKQKAKIVHYLKCYSKAFKKVNKTQQLDLQAINKSLTDDYNHLRKNEESAQIAKNPILYVARKIYQAAINENSETSLNPDSIVDIFMATQIFIDPEYIKVCAISSPLMDPHILPSRLQSFFEEIARKTSKEYFSESCSANANSLYPADRYLEESGTVTMFIKKLAAYATCAQTETQDLVNSFNNNFANKSTWTWDEQKRIAYHAFLWGRQITNDANASKGLYVFSDMIMKLRLKESEDMKEKIKKLYKANKNLFIKSSDSK